MEKNINSMLNPGHRELLKQCLKKEVGRPFPGTEKNSSFKIHSCYFDAKMNRLLFSEAIHSEDKAEFFETSVFKHSAYPAHLKMQYCS